jgi:hypothetical protein
MFAHTKPGQGNCPNKPAAYILQNWHKPPSAYRCKTYVVHPIFLGMHARTPADIQLPSPALTLTVFLQVLSIRRRLIRDGLDSESFRQRWMSSGARMMDDGWDMQPEASAMRPWSAAVGARIQTSAVNNCFLLFDCQSTRMSVNLRKWCSTYHDGSDMRIATARHTRKTQHMQGKITPPNPPPNVANSYRPIGSKE